MRFSFLLASVLIAASHGLKSSHLYDRLLQDDTDSAQVDPATLEYEDIPAVGAPQCEERMQCLATKDTWVRFGATIGRPPQEAWVYKKMTETGLFFCIISVFGSDPIVGSRKTCQQQVLPPSPSPTFAPTLFPTGEPTNSPSGVPIPTSSPTTEPTISPTAQPTESPSASPSASPSGSPSAAPTFSPTVTGTSEEVISDFENNLTNAPIPGASETIAPTFAPIEGILALCISMKSQDECKRIGLCDWNEGSCSKMVTDGSLRNGGKMELEWAPVVATNLAILAIVICITALSFIHIHRFKPVIQLSQALFLKLVCVGALLLNTAVFPYAFEPTTRGLCLLRKWWFDLAFTFTMGMMLVKVWRVWKVFNSPVGKSMHITNAYLIKCVTALLLVDVLLLVAWTASPGSGELSLDPQGNACSSSGAGLVMLAISYAFLAALVLVTAFFACRVKDLGSVLGESKQIFTIANNILVFGMFNILFAVSDTSSEDVRVLALSFSIFWCSIWAVVSLLYAKYERFYMTREEILRSATEKRGMSQGGSNFSNRDNTQNTFNTGAQTTTGNTGFLDEFEVQSMAGNPSFTFSDLASRTAQAPQVKSKEVLQMSRSQSVRANTDSAPKVRLPSSSSKRFENTNFGDKFLSGVRRPSPTSKQQNYGNMPESPVKSGSNTTSASQHSILQRYPTAEEVKLSKSDSEPENAPERSPKKTKESVDTITLESGFKVGERGLWEEYIHRETGETFWCHKKTGKIAHALEEIDGDLNIV